MSKKPKEGRVCRRDEAVVPECHGFDCEETALAYCETCFTREVDAGVMMQRRLDEYKDGSSESVAEVVRQLHDMADIVRDEMAGVVPDEIDLLADRIEAIAAARPGRAAGELAEGILEMAKELESGPGDRTSRHVRRVLRDDIAPRAAALHQENEALQRELSRSFGAELIPESDRVELLEEERAAQGRVMADLRTRNRTLRDACAFAIGALEAIEGERATVARDELMRMVRAADEMVEKPRVETLGVDLGSASHGTLTLTCPHCGHVTTHVLDGDILSGQRFPCLDCGTKWTLEQRNGRHILVPPPFHRGQRLGGIRVTLTRADEQPTEGDRDGQGDRGQAHGAGR